MEKEPIMPEPITRLELENEDVYLAPTTDRIDVFMGYGYGVLKALNEEGMMDLYHMDSKTAIVLAGRSGLPLVQRQYITPEENEMRLGYLESTIETWLDRE